MTEYTIITDLPPWLLHLVNWLFTVIADMSGHVVFSFEKNVSGGYSEPQN